MFVVLSLNLISAASGSIKTVRADCTDPVDENQYAIGDKVYLKGANFAPGEYDWSITGQPSKASCDPQEIVASGLFNVDSTGAFCFEAYTVNTDDCGEYKADFGNKKDNYRVNLNIPVVPEFGLFAAGLTIVSSIAIFFLVRRK